MLRRTIFVTLALTFCVLSNHAKGGIIDSISTREDVRNFLAKYISDEKLFYPEHCIDPSGLVKRRAHFLESMIEVMDTILAEDPITGNLLPKVIPVEYSAECRCCEGDSFSWKKSGIVKEVLTLTEHYPYKLSKADIDGNGFTDLVIDAGLPIIVLDMGGSYEGHAFSLEPGSIQFEGFHRLQNGDAALMLSHIDCPNGKATTDTVFYKHHSFLHLNAPTAQPSISKIMFRHIIGYGMSCDEEVYLGISDSGICEMAFRSYSTSFTGQVPSKYLNELRDLISQIDLKAMGDAYFSWMDHSEGAEFTFYFEDGSEKRIDIWACKPPIELVYLSKYLSEMCRTLDWQPMEGKSSDLKDRWKMQPWKEGRENCECE